MHHQYRYGFMLLESMITCAITMIIWYAIITCAVQALNLERSLEKKAYAVIAATTALEKLRCGLYKHETQTLHDNGLVVEISCAPQQGYSALTATSVMIKDQLDELLCVKTVLFSPEA